MVESIIEAVEVPGQHRLQFLQVFELQLSNGLAGCVQWGHCGDSAVLPDRWGQVRFPVV